MERKNGLAHGLVNGAFMHWPCSAGQGKTREGRAVSSDLKGPEQWGKL